MIPGVSGRLISTSFATSVLPELVGVERPPAHTQRAFVRWDAAREAALGPASSVRGVADVAVAPLLQLLGFRIAARRDSPDRCELMAEGSQATLPVIVTGWGESLDLAWRDTLRSGIAADARWCLCSNGRTVRLADAHRTWTRQYQEFDLESLVHVPEALALLWTLMRSEALGGPDPLLDRAVAASIRHGQHVCRSLANGVLDALRLLVSSLAPSESRRRAAAPHALLEESLTVLYRVLFLLFAEARGLVPVWHPVYRDRYTIEGIVSALLTRGRYRGVWAALHAISRLAHTGCRAGDLHVTAFNGRLFSPLHTPAAMRARVGDDTIAEALLAISSTASPHEGRRRIVYRDLDVEQLGAVYEHVLDYEVEHADGTLRLRRTGDVRKASGTFYTPRSVTSHLVRQTLAPLVEGRAASEILQLRVVDPAMGSGAFLVAACRFLASAAEEALIREGEWHAADVTTADRIALRRAVAQRCLFGVDLNPMAVQLARLSLWLATLAADKPLTFLDHRLVAGDSLAGASFEQIAVRPPGRKGHRPRAALPLFDNGSLRALVRDMVPTRVRLATERDEDACVVRRKESILSALKAAGSAAMRWKQVMDLWCACWFWSDQPAPNAAVYADLCDGVLNGRTVLPPRVAAAWQDRARSVADARRFLHWELEFPEVFFDEHGARRADAGFDAVLGNPPWDMVRGDSGDADRRPERRADARQLLEFARGSGFYSVDARSHVNRYQMFVERALHLVRPGGRIGFVLPGGIVSDAGSAPLRSRLFNTAAVDTIVGLDNRQGIFPIHRSVRFVLLTATAGGRTERISTRFGVADPDVLDRAAPVAVGAAGIPDALSLSRSFLATLSGEDDLAVPELQCPLDLRIVEKIAAAHPWLSSRDGWHVHFGRELNASDDRQAFRRATRAPDARPVLEGKQITPFRVALDESANELRPDAACTHRVPRRARLAYRDVASARNRLTLIAAIVPARAVTTHTLFCLREPLPLSRQRLLCALLNSFVANYLVRLRVHTHVTASIMARLPVPLLREGDPRAIRLAALAATLSEASSRVEAMPEYAELQALAGRAYGLSREEFGHVVGTFPLIPFEVREATVAQFGNVQ